jgi:hypothetical protein
VGGNELLDELTAGFVLDAAGTVVTIVVVFVAVVALLLVVVGAVDFTTVVGFLGVFFCCALLNIEVNCKHKMVRIICFFMILKLKLSLIITLARYRGSLNYY